MRTVHNFKSFLVAALVSLSMLVGIPTRVQADPMRDFVVSASYGVIAGTLVGAATLAFSDKPGDNLNKVARGASLGLYAGILLGAYIVYGTPNEDDEAAAAVAGGVGFHDRLTNQGRSKNRSLVVFPVIGERGVEGAGASFQFAAF